MTRRQTAALAGAITALSLVNSAAFSQAVSHTSNSSLSASTSPPAISASVHAPSVRYFHRRHESRHHSSRASVRSLPSRGASFGVQDASPSAYRLATVIADTSEIRASRQAYNRVLSVVHKGQNLAISGETANDYAVVMIDHSLGFVPKSDVQILDYQVVNTASPDDSLGTDLTRTATDYLGVPYVWGGNTRNGIDCSGFVKAIFAAHGMELPRFSGDQATVGYDVPRGDWHQWVPGDRMYFACHHPRIDHTGMYIGNGYFIHASVGHGRQVAIDRVDNAYFAKHLVAVRRSRELLSEAPTQTVTPVPPHEDQSTVSMADSSVPTDSEGGQE